jgi:hypothetical protein
MVNYTQLAATAQRLIEANGRSVTLVERSSTPEDASKPWRGPDEDVTPPTQTTVTGVFLSATSETELGELLQLIDAGLIQRGQKFLMVAADSLPSTLDIRAQASVLDGAQSWAVQEVATLQPGSTPLLHALVLNA